MNRSGVVESFALEHGGKRRRKSVGWLETERLEVCVREVGIAQTGKRPAGSDRAVIVAWKGGKPSGAKGGRKMDAE